MPGTSERFAKFSVGLTGGIGSGKTAASDWFAAQGVTVIDTDAIAHALTSGGGAAIPAIRREFGDALIQADGAMHRARMRDLAFNDENVRQRLQSILHPLIDDACRKQAEHAGGQYLLFVVPLLVESGAWRQRVDRVLVIDAPDQLRIARVMQRSGLSREQVLAIMATQASRQARLDAADDIVVNDRGLTELQSQLAILHQRYLELADKSKV
jgi:dephospho-CoA kinase